MEITVSFQTNTKMAYCLFELFLNEIQIPNYRFIFKFLQQISN